jgi:hypothetical protein
MSTNPDYLRVVEGLPEALAECAGVAEAAAELLLNAPDKQAVADSAYYALMLLKRRLCQIEEHFHPDAVQERQERDEYRRTYITTREFRHEI